MNNTLLDKFTSIANMVPVPFYCLDLNQRYIGINQSGLAELGLIGNKEDLSSKTPYDIYPGPVASRLVKHHQEAIRTGKALELNEFISDEQGKKQTYCLTISPVHDSSSNIIGTSAISIKLMSGQVASLPTTVLSNDKLFSNLKKLADTIPVPFYWLDLHQCYLGINQVALQLVSASLDKHIIQDKTPYDLYPKALASEIVAQHQEVIKVNKKVIKELKLEALKSLNRQDSYFISTVFPLHDNQGNIISTYGVLVDVTLEKKANRLESDNQSEESKLLRRIEQIADTFPIAFYWFDLKQCCIVVNKANILNMQESGIKNPEESIVGKTLYDIHPYEIAYKIELDHKHVVRTNKVILVKEFIKDRVTGKRIYYEVIIAPLRNDQGNAVGTYGFYTNITAQEEARLRREVQQEKFNRIIFQAAHDIRSPLAGMLMIVKASSTLPLDIRLALKDAASSINDIAENLLQNWQVVRDRDSISQEQQAEPLLVSLLAMQVIAGKRFQFQDSLVKFDLEIDEDSYFSCMQANTSRFKRTLSNLINNAVASYGDQPGTVICQLHKEDNQVLVTIKDQGKGIAPDVLDKIKQGIQVTQGKREGQGIGLTQVRDTLELFQGELEIDSAIGKGTKVRLSFPVGDLAPWLADSINLKQDDILVIVDDDDSMHRAWQAIFNQKGYGGYLGKQSVQFTKGEQAIAYINRLEDKSKLVLLTDYELLNQPLNGVDIIKQTGVKGAIVVTSHYDDKQLRQFVDGTGVKILPKQLAHQVPLAIN